MDHDQQEPTAACLGTYRHPRIDCAISIGLDYERALEGPVCLNVPERGNDLCARRVWGQGLVDLLDRCLGQAKEMHSDVPVFEPTRANAMSNLYEALYASIPEQFFTQRPVACGLGCGVVDKELGGLDASGGPALDRVPHRRNEC